MTTIEDMDQQPAGEDRVCCCALCGSTDIVIDAYARWDEGDQDWVLAFFTERKAVSCMSCSAKEGSLIWKAASEIKRED